MLRSEDVILRAVKNSDSDLLYQVINCPEVVAFNAPFKPTHEVNHQSWMVNILNDKTKEFFIIEYFDKPIGSVQLVDIDSIHRNAELKIRIFDETDRGKNIGTKVLELLTEHAFSNLGLVRVWLRVFNNNERAISAYKKAGFMAEGTMKKAAFINGEFLDVICMAKIND